MCCRHKPSKFTADIFRGTKYLLGRMAYTYGINSDVAVHSARMYIIKLAEIRCAESTYTIGISKLGIVMAVYEACFMRGNPCPIRSTRPALENKLHLAFISGVLNIEIAVFGYAGTIKAAAILDRKSVV